MRMVDHLVKSGDFFFRWRSYIPLLLLPIVIASFNGFSYPYNSYLLNLLWELGCLVISVIGLVIRIVVSGTVPAGTSGRNTREQKASVLNTTGIYSIVRHPLYLGNLFIALGLSLLPRKWYLPITLSLAFALYYERIIVREETFLEKRFGERFRLWANEVPVIIPNFKKYRQSDLQFSFKTALKKEFHGFFSITTTFFAMDLIGTYAVQGEFVFNPFWTSGFLLGLSFYIIMVFLKKRTKTLIVEGR